MILTNMDYHNDEPAPASISAVIKHIKVYSDNPIHDCIDRIITACTNIDEDCDYCYFSSLELKAAAEDLFILATQRYAKIRTKTKLEIDEQD